jgi:hypothetical protein
MSTDVILGVVMLATSVLTQATEAAPRVQPAPSDVVTVVQRASAWLADYVKALSSVVSEERYEQILSRNRSLKGFEPVANRTLLSDFLLVQVSGSSSWLPFRDVYSVDGRPVRDRSDRLLKLFVESPGDAFGQAVRIREESSRYNIGGGLRDTNVPTFALQFLSAKLRGRFTFKAVGHELIGDVDTVVVEYQETTSPTIVLGRVDEDVPAKGRFWVDPGDGRVLRTRLETRPNGGTNVIDVDYRHDQRLGVLVPHEMIEHRFAGAEVLEGHATYSNFRRFRVDTSIEIK